MALEYSDDDDNDDASSSSSSSGSDDDFLTSGDGGENSRDREDLIRKKLLESFYGTSATAAEAAEGASSNAADDSSVPGGAASGTGSSDAASGGRELSAAVTEMDPSKAVQTSMFTPSSCDLDSPHFSAPSFAERHIRSSSVHTLLETDESLALDIRSLDSTMQTLVYENYSKFIDATDAIRSIGQSVDSSKAGLDRLRLGIDRIERGTTVVDAALRMSRDAVAEKIRVKRLLARLDALLRLPKTLLTQIDAGRYRLAARSHASATAILGRHSAGFESLKSIEVECNAILNDMIMDLRRKLMHWSGEVQRRSSPLLQRRKHLLGADGDDDADNGGGGEDVLDVDVGDSFAEDDYYEEADELSDTGTGTPDLRRRRALPDPPRNVAEIFECAGTLLLLSREEGGMSEDDAAVATCQRHHHLPRFETGLSSSECKSLALDACGRLLERLLDAHNIQMEEEALRAAGDGKCPGPGTVVGARKVGPPAPPSAAAISSGGHLIPTAFLDGVLESATLYGITLSGSPSVATELLATSTAGPGVGIGAGNDLAPVRGGMTPQDLRLLTDFVSTLFGTFLGHVRMALLERSIEGEDRASRLALATEEDGTGGTAEARRAAEEADESAFAEISSALAHLLRSVRELASGLALPEIGLNVDAASDLVEQTAELTESIVRRRVARKFVDLRARVTRETLGPFVRDALAEPPLTTEEGGMGMGMVAGGSGGGVASEGARVVCIVRVASVALSDGMQLVDDAIRAMLSRDSALGSPGAPVDPSVVRHAVERDARKFGLWLAATLELLAGLDYPDPKVTLDVRLPKGEDLPAEEGEGRIAASSKTKAAVDDEIRSLNATAASCADNYGASPSPDDDDDSPDDDESSDLIERILLDLEEEASPETRSDLTLAVAELCRLAERTVPEGMNQSVALSTEEETRSTIKAGGFFESTGPTVAAVMRAAKSDVDPDGALAARFQVAASRSLQLFATSRGNDAASFGCANVMDVARTHFSSAEWEEEGGAQLPAAPSEKAWRILEVAKRTCVDCAAVLGGDTRSGPVPAFPEEDDAGTLLMSGRAPLGGGGGGLIKGLQLDVERMFTERVRIHPHPSRPMEFDRTAVVATVLKAAFRAMVDASRVCSFSPAGYRQMQVDCEFLRHLLTHYLRDEDMSDGTNPVTGLCNLLNDTMINAGERCSDANCVGVSEYYDEAAGDIVVPLSIARRFMEEQEELGEDGVLSLFMMANE